ncbi:TIGR04104 family putative zinc finger protein [Sporosarcina aquimarina]|uniref:TIGR04104 family putative zinc finger protein n=1 Tax=Sporosarcina aquimarina TaxID=114975 RepID=UPI0032E7FE06
MSTCQNCNNMWNWKQTIRKTTTLDPAMTCPNCGEKQYQTQKSKKRISFLTVIILLPLLIQTFSDIPVIMLLSLLPVIAVIVFLLYPFFVELSSKERYIGEE